MRAWPLLAYAVLYALSLGVLSLREGLDPAEPLLVLATIGVGFSALAWWATRGLTPRSVHVRAPRREGPGVLAYLVLLTGFITWGLPAVRALASPGWPAELLVLAAKLSAFVALPIWIWRRRFGYSVADLLPLRDGLRGHWRPTLVLSGAIVLFQALLGRARTELPGLDPSGLTFLAFVGGFAWLVLDVGAVEEFTYRALLQTRLAAWADSDRLALVGAAVLFGLAHVPGLYLRPELMGEGVGASPSLLLATSYSIVYTSVSGLYLGVLWLRTRNLWVVAVVHAAQDWLPTVLDSLRKGYLGA